MAPGKEWYMSVGVTEVQVGVVNRIIKAYDGKLLTKEVLESKLKYPVPFSVIGCGYCGCWQFGDKCFTAVFYLLIDRHNLKLWERVKQPPFGGLIVHKGNLISVVSQCKYCQGSMPQVLVHDYFQGRAYLPKTNCDMVDIDE
jgi:hypothetical protein